MSLEKLLARVGIGAVGANTVWSSAGLLMRAVVQAAYLVLVSRALGPEAYGIFAGSIAAIVLLVPLSGWGASMVMHREVSQNGIRTQAMWAATIVQILLTGTLLVVAAALAGLLLPTRIHLGWMLLLGLSELVALPLVHAGTAMSQARERGGLAATCMVVVPMTRLLSVAGCVLTGWNTLQGIVVGHVLGTLSGMTLVILMMRATYGRPDWRGRPGSRKMARDGSKFTAGFLLGTSTYEVDKVLLLQLVGPGITGAYSVAYRVLSVFAMPLQALVGAALPRLYSNEAGRIALARAVLLTATGYALLATAACFTLAPALGFVFGTGYEESSRYLAWLAPWLVIYALHLSLATLLTAMERQNARVLVEAVGLAAIVVLNLLLVPIYGVLGAVIALLVCETLIVCGCIFLLSGRTGHQQEA